MGVFGINSEIGESSEWLSRLAEIYSEEAIAEGIAFASKLFPANEPSALLDELYHMDFDLIVIPKNLTRFGNHGERLMQSIVSRLDTSVLVCP